MHFLQILYFTAEMEKVHAMESVAVLVKYLDASIAFTIFLLPPSMKFGQGYIFTGICDPVHRGGSALVHAGILPPPARRHPPAQCMLGDTVNKQAVCILLECNSCFVLLFVALATLKHRAFWILISTL